MSDCTQQYAVEGPIHPHIVQCDIPKTAREIEVKLHPTDTRGSMNLYLWEVKVTGTEPAPSKMLSPSKKKVTKI